MNTITFYKMQASGNDFVVIDHRESFITDVNEFAQHVCVRQFGVGADGVLLVEKSDDADFKMRIINADGSEADMCGNGSRCIALFAHELLKFPDKMRIETGAGIISAVISEKKIKVQLTKPIDYKAAFELDVDGNKKELSFINTGVPHVIHFPESLSDFPVNEIGGAIRFHEKFSPLGVNVNFVEVTGPHDISVRTYERGVESETFACGTGSTASALISALQNKVKSPVNVFTTGGEVLKICFELEGDDVKEVFMEGEAHISFRGELIVT